MLPAKPYLQSVCIRPDAEVDYVTYPYNIPAVREMGRLEFHPDVTFLVGENGSGKSTLLEAIAVALGYSPQGGTRDFAVGGPESVSPLHEVLRLARSFRQPKDGYFLRAESFFNVATFVDDNGVPDAYGTNSLHGISHGEAFMSLLAHKFRGKGLYLLDEPEAALSPNRQMPALSAIHQLVEDKSQFIIATHSPILLSYPHAKIVLFDGTGLSEVAYEHTEHYAVTHDFLNNYCARLDRLLDQD